MVDFRLIWAQVIRVNGKHTDHNYYSANSPRHAWSWKKYFDFVESIIKPRRKIWQYHSILVVKIFSNTVGLIPALLSKMSTFPPRTFSAESHRFVQSSGTVTLHFTKHTLEKNGPTPATFSLIFLSFQTQIPNFTTNRCVKKLSIQYTLLGFEFMAFGAWVSSKNH